MSYYQDPVQQPANPYAGYPYQDSKAPRGLAIASAILAGVVTLVQIGAALTASSAVEAFTQNTREASSPADVLTAYDVFVMMALPALLAAYIVTCLWLMQSWNLLDERVPSSLRTRSKIWVWLGWWVPIVSLWFPYQVVRDIRKGSIGHPTGASILVGWWTFWLVYHLGDRVSASLQPNATNTSRLDALPWVEGFNALFLVVALAFWLGIIRQITRGQDALLAATAGSATGY